VAVDGSELYWYCYNDYLFRATVTFDREVRVFCFGKYKKLGKRETLK